MELIFDKYNFSIKNNSINTIMGNGINYNLLEDACLSNHNIGIIIHPVINEILYKTVKEELTNSFKTSNHTDNKIILNSLKMVGLSNNYINKTIKELSSSEIYLIKLASILIKNPQIIILDNPNIYLDSNNLNNFLKIIRTIKRRYNKTIIIFSNNSNFVHNISDYLIIINKDKIIAQGNKYEIFNNEQILKENKIKIPNIIEFEKLVKNNKNINIGLRDNTNDLIKDICYHIEK